MCVIVEFVDIYKVRMNRSNVIAPQGGTICDGVHAHDLHGVMHAHYAMQSRSGYPDPIGRSNRICPVSFDIQGMDAVLLNISIARVGFGCKCRETY